MFEFLKQRGLRFLEEAVGDYEKEYYDFCLFHTEQMLQLLLKYLIAVKTDDFPRIHSISKLFRNVAELYGDNVMEFYKDNVSIIIALEEAYIGARYVDIEFNKEIAGEAIKFGEIFMKLVEELSTYGSGNH
ncbi:MAG: HEPN domain-containing protein [Thermodesulfobacteriota bacterium]